MMLNPLHLKYCATPQGENVRTFLFSLIVGFILGIIGMLIGALIGGNFATEVVFNGVRGYEATGQIGFIIFALIGMVAAWQFMAKKKQQTH
jgi:hypothetical protein